jgi:hypothetical protein
VRWRSGTEDSPQPPLLLLLLLLPVCAVGARDRTALTAAVPRLTAGGICI